MGDLQERALAAVQDRFGDHVRGQGEHAGQHWVFVDRSVIVDVLKMLRDDLGFNMLTDLTAVDYLDKDQPERFAMVYILRSLKEFTVFRVKVWIPEDDAHLSSVSSVFLSAPWAEREVWDLFGIHFDNHPDLRRLLLPDWYPGHPLRKDYPLQGHGERHDFPRYRS